MRGNKRKQKKTRKEGEMKKVVMYNIGLCFDISSEK